MRPIVVRNVLKTSPGRSRFDLAHDVRPSRHPPGNINGDKDTESQANQFAAASSCQPQSIYPSISTNVSTHRLAGHLRMKVRWRVSAKAVLGDQGIGLLDAVAICVGESISQSIGAGEDRRFDDQLPSEVPELLRTAIMNTIRCTLRQRQISRARSR